MTTDIPDFGGPQEAMHPRPFDIGADRFFISGSQPAGVLFDMAALGEAKSPADQVKIVMRLLEASLVPESYERFVARMRSTENPITLQQVLKVLRWGFEQQTDRPTEPSPFSPVAPSTTGMSSTAGVPARVSTP